MQDSTPEQALHITRIRVQERKIRGMRGERRGGVVARKNPPENGRGDMEKRREIGGRSSKCL